MDEKKDREEKICCAPKSMLNQPLPTSQRRQRRASSSSSPRAPVNPFCDKIGKPSDSMAETI